MASATTAVLACVGCGCGSAACLAPADALPGPLADVKMAIVQVYDNFTGGNNGEYAYGNQRWDSRAGSWR